MTKDQSRLLSVECITQQIYDHAMVGEPARRGKKWLIISGNTMISHYTLVTLHKTSTIANTNRLT